jgi:hypothetical protein
MNVRYAGVLAGLLLASACQNRASQEQAGTGETDTALVATAPRARQCYAYETATDTVRLSFTRSGENVTGELGYRLREKDRNTGTLTGTMRGDTLLADYTFGSEGIESVREVAFLFRDGRVVEGYGPVAQRAGKVVFRDRRSLSFTPGFVLQPVVCPEVPPVP